MKEESISFHNEDFDFKLKNEQKYILWLTTIALNHDVEIDQLSYIFASDQYVLELNKQYLNHDYYTDILSFPINDAPLVGDIVISIDRVKDNAETLKLDFDSELLRVMAHGLLHFLGYDDHSDSDITQMRQQEDQAISLFQSLQA